MRTKNHFNVFFKQKKIIFILVISYFIYTFNIFFSFFFVDCHSLINNTYNNNNNKNNDIHSIIRIQNKKIYEKVTTITKRIIII